jgi:hypothetical protein
LWPFHLSSRVWVKRPNAGRQVSGNAQTSKSRFPYERAFDRYLDLPLPCESLRNADPKGVPGIPPLV